MKAILLLLCLSCSYAWWCNGHMLTALVGELDLLNSSPSSYDLASKTVQVLNGPLTHGTSNTFVESACWADDIKAYSLTYLNYGHFRDIPYNPTGLLNTPTPPEDLLWTFGQIDATLSTQNYKTAPLETSFSVRFLIHIIGDMHQPLHCAQLWSATYPKGDAGGNFFKIVFDYGIKQLHALWDSGIGMWKDDLPRPLSNESWDLLHVIAESVMEEWPRSKLSDQLSFKNPSDWCQQSFDDAIGTVYSNIKENQRPSDEYLAHAWSLVKKQIALGGYRMSDTMKIYYQ